MTAGGARGCYPRRVIRVSSTTDRPPTPPLERTAFVVLWATGPDTALDGLFKLEALKRSSPEAAWEHFETLCRPFEGSDASASARMAHEYGITGPMLQGAPTAALAFAQLADFVEDCTVLTSDSETFDAWWQAHAAERPQPASIGVADVAALFLPGRLALRREELVPDLAGGERRALTCEQVRAALLALAERIHALPQAVLHLAVHGLVAAWRGFAGPDERAAARLRLAIAVLDRPERWSGGGELPFAALKDGVLAGMARDDAALEDLIDAVQPRASDDAPRWRELQPVAPQPPDEGAAFHEEDMARLDDVFQVHLPRAFAAATNTDPRRAHRRTQHEVARQVALTLGQRELLLMHAPTGTGKTLAYLIPSMLWAARHNLRIGLATYTRALQEQAWDKEVPRALGALRAAGVPALPRVAVLKGRENYACWRAIRHSPPEDEAPEAWLAWTQVALFALTDGDADLDRLPTRAPLPLEDNETYAKTFESTLRSSRARPACCLRRVDKDACGAELARLKAERSHVVIVNQAFALSRQDFFRVLVFDECEHLHEQAHSVWSRMLALDDIPALLARLRQPAAARRGKPRAVLDRLRQLCFADEDAAEALKIADEGWSGVRTAYAGLVVGVAAFDAWRIEAARGRTERDLHSLLKEWIVDHAEESAELLEARVQFEQAGNELDAALAALAEHLGRMPSGGSGATRRNLDLARVELAEQVETMRAWIPIEEGAPRFAARTFYDVEIEQRGGTRRCVLAARVLLPNEYLGDLYYPQLHSAVFLSATTWLRGSFESSIAYLGIDTALKPRTAEMRVAHTLRTHQAAEVFDYARVQVCVPTDAPTAAQGGKDRFLEYVRSFLAHLAERTRGRLLVLFTSSDDVRRVGLDLQSFFRARRLPLLWQGMRGSAKEELAELFRSRVDATLMGVDTFWYGADFPGETLEHLVIVKLPFGVPDRYHQAQCAALGFNEQNRQIYRPRALAKLRQGFGRLMRRESDRGVVYLLDQRVLEPKHKDFLRELPLAANDAHGAGAQFVRGSTELCLQKAFAFMGLTADIRRRGLDLPFQGPVNSPLEHKRPARDEEPPPDLTHEELPF